MQNSKNFHRNTADAMIGGVCAGVAERYGTDTFPVRLLAVLLAVASFGLFGLVYLYSMIRWPEKQKDSPHEVRPRQVDSRSFGVFNGSDIERLRLIGRLRTDAPPSVGHTPPVPPKCYIAQYGTDAAPYFQYRKLAAKGVSAQAARTVQTARAVSTGGSGRPAGRNRIQLNTVVMLLVAGAVFLLAVLMDYVIASAVDEISERECLPLFFMLLGVALLFVPTNDYPLYGRVSFGLELLLFGAFALGISTGVLSTEVASRLPVIACLVLMLAMSIVAFRRADREGYSLLLVAVILFGFVVFFLCAMPGALDCIRVTLPTIGTFVAHVNPWL